MRLDGHYYWDLRGKYKSLFWVLKRRATVFHCTEHLYLHPFPQYHTQNKIQQSQQMLWTRRPRRMTITECCFQSSTGCIQYPGSNMQSLVFCLFFFQISFTVSLNQEKGVILIQCGHWHNDIFKMRHFWKQISCLHKASGLGGATDFYDPSGNTGSMGLEEILPTEDYTSASFLQWVLKQK